MTPFPFLSILPLALPPRPVPQWRLAPLVAWRGPMAFSLNRANRDTPTNTHKLGLALFEPKTEENDFEFEKGHNHKI